MAVDLGAAPGEPPAPLPPPTLSLVYVAGMSWRHGGSLRRAHAQALTIQPPLFSHLLGRAALPAGGWTHVLAQRARLVLAVDPAPMDERALVPGVVTHLACKAEAAVQQIVGMVGEAGVDLIVSGVHVCDRTGVRAAHIVAFPSLSGSLAADMAGWHAAGAARRPAPRHRRPYAAVDPRPRLLPAVQT